MGKILIVYASRADETKGIAEVIEKNGEVYRHDPDGLGPFVENQSD